MPMERAQRDHRLIERTAALLSEEYPLEQLLSRVSDVVRAELGATLVFVALQSGATLEIAAASGSDPVDVANEAAPAVRAFYSGEPVLVNSGEAGAAWSCQGSASELAVPIKYRDTPLGVLSVCSREAGGLVEGDIDLLAALGRYLGIAVRNQRRGSPVQIGRRSSWTIVAVAALAVLLTFGLFEAGIERVQEARSAAQAQTQQRASTVAVHIEDYLQVAQQMATTAASMFGGAPHDRSATQELLLRLLASATNSAVYGTGVWYEPYRYDNSTRWYGPYAHYTPSHRMVLTDEWMRPSYNFQRQGWYRLGVAHPSTVSFTDPYFDTDATYFTAVRTFTGPDGRVAGVVTVDSIMPTMSSMVSDQDLQGSVAVVEAADGSMLFTSADASIRSYAAAEHTPIKTTWKMPRAVFDGFLKAKFSGAYEASERVEGTGWTLHVYTQGDSVEVAVRRTVAVISICTILLWLAAAAIIYALLFARSHRRRAHSLEAERHALEREIADRLAAEERLREQAYRDELTGLPNRSFIVKHIAQTYKDFRADGKPFAVLFIDLDRFNLINDSLGHRTGDALLVEFAQRLRYALRTGDVLGRLGGDEYVIVLENANASAARERANAVTAVLHHPFVLSGHELFVTVSIGVAVADDRYASGDEILRDADGAMYEAKRAGRSTTRVFDQSMHTRATEQLALESDLRRALESNELFVEYQPIVSLADGCVAGFEALARWSHRSRGRVRPDVFIKLAEQSGMIVTLDEQIIRQATRDAVRWQEEFPQIAVSVNASAAHLARIDDAAAIKSALLSSGLPPESLKIEITETAVMENGEKAFEALVHLRGMGARLVIDDFGTGYSSLSYLQQLPVEELKIDRSFVSMMLHNEQAAEIVRAIVAVAKTLHLRVTAEGVETQDEIERLRRLGVEYAQGYAFGMPRPFESALQMLRAQAAEQAARPRTSLETAI